MSFARPTLTAIVTRARADQDGRLAGADSSLSRSVLDVLARVHARANYDLYGYLDWIARQIMPDTADAEELARWAAVWGVARKAATSGAGTGTLAGTNGAIVPAGTLLARADGDEFVATAAATIAGGTAVLPIAAVTPGAASATAAGQQLTFVSPIAGVQAIATVGAGGISGGADEEDDDSLRARLLERIRRPPDGGTARDYLDWALAVPGVTRAWVFPQQLGPGTVGLTFACDGRDDIFPTEDDVDAVQAALDALRPVTAALTVYAPNPLPLVFVIRAAPPSADVEAAVAAQLVDLLRREAEPGGTILLSHIDQAISLAPGLADFTLIAPQANVAADAGSLPTFGGIEWAA